MTVAAARARTRRGARAPHGGRTRALVMLAAGVVAFAGYLVAGPRALQGPQTVDAPRENAGWVLAENLADGRGASIPLEHHDRLPPDIARALTPRDAAAIDGRVVPQDFAGSVLLYAALLWLWKPLALVLVPALAVLSAFLLAQLTVELLEPGGRWHAPATSRAAWASGLVFALWLTYPGLVLTGSMLFDSAVPTLVALLTAALSFVRFWRAGRTANLVWLMVALGAAIALRYPSLFFAVPLGIALLLGRRLSVRRALLATAALVPFAAIVLGFNAAVYGSPTTTGYHLSTEALNTSRALGGGIFTFVPSAFVNHLRFYALEQPVILVPALAGMVAGLWRARTERALVAALVMAAVALLVTHAGLETWGSAHAAINASFIRYALPAVGIGLALLAVAVVPGEGRRRTAVALGAGLLIAASIWTAVAGPVALLVRHDELDTGRWVRAAVLEHTPPDALVAAGVSDRVLFPQRQTLTLAHLATPDEVIRLEVARSRWDQVPTPARFADVAARVLERDIPLYLLHDFEAPLGPYAEALRARGLTLEAAVSGGLRYPTLYRVARD